MLASVVFGALGEYERVVGLVEVEPFVISACRNLVRGICCAQACSPGSAHGPARVGGDEGLKTEGAERPVIVGRGDHRRGQLDRVVLVGGGRDMEPMLIFRVVVPAFGQSPDPASGGLEPR